MPEALVIKRTMRPGTLTLLGAISVSFFWGAVESLVCHAAARHRLARGLTDPVAVDRFLLWGVSSGACAALIFVLIGCVLADMVILQRPLPLSTIAACGAVMSASGYLTFFTPDRYRRFVVARSRR